MSNYIDQELEAVLVAMPIGELRKTAKQGYGINLSRDMTAEDIRAAIHHKKAKHNFVTQANESSLPAPGMWRIMLHKTSDQGAKAGSRPATFRVNGFFVTIPRNVVVDVPEKVVRAIENTIHYEMVDDDETGRVKIEPRMSFPFQILASTPGPDPKPGYEKAKARYYARRLAYLNEFGHWPKNQAEVRSAEERGLIGPQNRNPVNKSADVIE